MKTKTIRFDSINEAAFYSDKVLPQVFTRDYAFSTTLLKSAIFRPAKGKRSVYTESNPMTVFTADADKIQLIGTELRQDDQTVLLAFIKECSGRILSQAGASGLIFTPRAFARDVLGWPDAGHSVDKLLDCLKRLKSTHLQINYAKGGEGTISFVADYSAKSGHDWQVYLSPRLVALFADKTTYIDVEKRRSLREGLQTWLFGLINADPCKEPIDLTKLKEMAGVESEQKKFNYNLRSALEVLQEKGCVENFTMDGRVLKLKRRPR